MNKIDHATTCLAAVVILALGVATGYVYAADIYKGREVYQLHCGSCHGDTGFSAEPGMPDFTRGESLMVPDNDLVRSIREGVGAMPAYRGMLDDAEIRDVVAYLRSLQQ